MRQEDGAANRLTSPQAPSDSVVRTRPPPAASQASTGQSPAGGSSCSASKDQRPCASRAMPTSQSRPSRRATRARSPRVIASRKSAACRRAPRRWYRPQSRTAGQAPAAYPHRPDACDQNGSRVRSPPRRHPAGHTGRCGRTPRAAGRHRPHRTAGYRENRSRTAPAAGSARCRSPAETAWRRGTAPADAGRVAAPPAAAPTPAPRSGRAPAGRGGHGGNRRNCPAAAPIRETPPAARTGRQSRTAARVAGAGGQEHAARFPPFERACPAKGAGRRRPVSWR